MVGLVLSGSRKSWTLGSCTGQGALAEELCGTLGEAEGQARDTMRKTL